MSPRVVILDAGWRALYAVVLVTSVWILLRGHNAPGGGFIGGLVAVSATVICAVAAGAPAARRRLPLGEPTRLLAAGVLLSVASGLPAWVTGDPFLTHRWGTVPLVGVKVSTVLLFDVGVYLCVWGALSGYALELLDDDESGGTS